MKKILMGLTLVVSAPSFACGPEEANNLIYNGIAESAANDCLDDGIGLKKLSDSLKHFVSIVEDFERDSCDVKFAPGLKKTLIDDAIETAKRCVNPFH